MLEMEFLQVEMINRSYPLSHNNTIMNLLIFLDASSNYIIADNYDSSSNDHVNIILWYCTHADLYVGNNKWMLSLLHSSWIVTIAAALDIARD